MSRLLLCVLSQSLRISCRLVPLRERGGWHRVRVGGHVQERWWRLQSILTIAILFSILAGGGNRCCIGGGAGSIVRGACSGSSRLQLWFQSPVASRLSLLYLLHGSVFCAERFRRPRRVLGV